MRTSLPSWALWKSLRVLSRPYTTLQIYASSPPYDPNKFGAEKVESRLLSGRNLPGLYRSALEVDTKEGNDRSEATRPFGAKYCTHAVYSSARRMPKDDQLNMWQNVIAQTQKPDRVGVLSAFEYIRALANGLLQASPHAENAIVKLHSANSNTVNVNHFNTWTLQCISTRSPPNRAGHAATFLLSMLISLRDIRAAGSSEFEPGTISVNLYMQPRGEGSPRAAQVASARIQRSADDDRATLAAVTKWFSDGLQRHLQNRMFTSNASLAEAAILFAERNFHQTLLSRDFDLVDVQTHTEFGLLKRGWRNIATTKAALYYQRTRKIPYLFDSFLAMKPSRPDDTPRSLQDSTSENGINSSPIQRAIGCTGIDLSVAWAQQLDDDGTTDLGTIARSFEAKCTTTGLQSLICLLKGFGAAVYSLPAHVADALIIKAICQPPKATVPFKHGNQHQLLEQPTHHVELRYDSATESISTSIRLNMCKSRSVRFNQPDREDFLVHVKHLTLRMAPLSTSSLGGETPSGAISVEQEIHHLVASASNVLNKVCDGVKFEDATMVPAMLAEAVLRVVRPLTPSMKLEDVSLGALIGDDPLVLTKTMSLKSLEAAKHPPGLVTLSSGDHDLPLHTASNVVYTMMPRPMSKNLRLKTGYTCISTEILFASCTEFGMRVKAFDPTKVFIRSLGKVRSGDFHALSEATCNIKEKRPGISEAQFALCDWPEQKEAPVSGVRFFSTGEICCEPPAFYSFFVGLQNVFGNELAPLTIKIYLWGTPSQSTRDLTAHQQIERIHEALGSQLASSIDRKIFRDDEEFRHAVLKAIKEADKALATHLKVTSSFVSATFGEESSVASSQQNSDLADEHRELENVGLDESSLNDSGELEWRSADGNNDGYEQPSLFVRGDHSSTAIRELIEKLDFQLMLIESPAAALEQLMDELDNRLASALLDQANTIDRDVHRGNHDPPVQHRRPMERGVVIALGSNVGNKIEEIEKACRAIDADPDMRIVDTSQLYETKPMYVEDQDTFVNGACEIETSLSPIELLDRLQAIEQRHGRVKLVDKGPRNIDLDIAIFRDEIVDSERLTVPHMLMHEREFVVRPIMDLMQLSEWANPRDQTPLWRTHRDLCSSSESDMHTVTPLAKDKCLHATLRTKPTHVMSIFNTTPDSFSDGGSNALDPRSLRETAAAHIAAGATIIDVGGQSSRPNAPDVTAEEEIARVLPAIAAIKSLPEAKDIAISVDTYRAAVAEAAVLAGADIVNDISGGLLDPQMLPTVARLGCTYVLMHMRGTPATMQNPENCSYQLGIRTVMKELLNRMDLAVQAGIRRWRIIVDPGVGFAKDEEMNLSILAQSKAGLGTGITKKLNRVPWLVGSSRKGFIGRITGVAEPKDRIWGTAAAVTASIRGGADIVRVHDVEEMVQVAKMADAIYRKERKQNNERAKGR